MSPEPLLFILAASAGSMAAKGSGKWICRPWSSYITYSTGSDNMAAPYVAVISDNKNSDSNM